MDSNYKSTSYIQSHEYVIGDSQLYAKWEGNKSKSLNVLDQNDFTSVTLMDVERESVVRNKA